MRDKADLAELFRSHGLRMTPQREIVFDVLIEFGTGSEDTHPTADLVWNHVKRRSSSISLKTIYDILHELARLGEIRQIDLGTGSALFELNETTHHHFVCTSCARVFNVDFGSVTALPMANSPTYAVQSTEVIFRGLCDDCVAGSPASII